MATTTTTGSAATSTVCGTSAQYELPVKDAACGIPNSDKYEGYLSKCAKSVGVTSYNNDCAIYALAVDQSVQDLTDCLYDAGVKWKDVWCYGSTNATATAASYPTSKETSSALSTDKKKSSTSTSSSATSTSTSGATVTLPNAHTSLKGVMVLSTLFVGAVFMGI